MKIKDICIKKIYKTKTGLWYVDSFSNGHVFLIGKNRKLSIPLIYFATDVINECSKLKTFLFFHFHIKKTFDKQKIYKLQIKEKSNNFKLFL